MAQFETAYGFFDDEGREYVVTRPDTPMPWINVLSNGDYGMTISQAGGGYSWRTHASLNRITRWDQDLIRDAWGKFLYIREPADGAIWSPTRQPAGEGLEAHRARHGMGYTVFEARRGALRSALTMLVAPDAPCELWLLELANDGPAERRLQVCSYFEWGLGAAPDWHREFHRTFIETAYDEGAGALLATKLLWDIPGEEGPHWNRSWPYVAFHSAAPRPAGFDADKRSFLGRHGDPRAPLALQEGRLAGRAGRFGDAIGSLMVELTVPAGGTAAAVFILGAADSREEAIELSRRYAAPEAAREALAETRRRWAELVGGLHVDTPDPAFNLQANGWLAYQAISGRLWGRTAYYQMGGAYGYRDQLQDSLAWLLLGQPERTRAQILLHAAHQYQEGVVLHWWHPLAESGLRSRYSDDLLWLPFVTLRYLHEAGDEAILYERVPYYDGGEGPLLEHCLRAFAVALGRRSERGLPLILEADWNDGLNAVGAACRGESVWMAHFLHHLLLGWAALPALDGETSERFRAEAAAIREAANTHAWDGRWYWRASTDDGKILGSRRSDEGQIFLNAQTWAVLGGVADEARAAQAMAAAREQLFTPYGALLLAPAYTRPDASVGYLTRYAPGTRENGGVYMHAACWAILAERRVAGADGAYALWRSMSPVLRGMEPEAYSAEPYVMPGNVDGPLSASPGRAGWTWYTGSAAWFLRAMVEGVLGVEVTADGLRVRPELPGGWPGFSVRRRVRRAVYQISVRRAGAGERPGCWVDGRPHPQELIPFAPPGSTTEIRLLV